MRPLGAREGVGDLGLGRQVGFAAAVDRLKGAGLLEAVAGAVAAHAAGVEQSDDITMVAFRYRGTGKTGAGEGR